MSESVTAVTIPQSIEPSDIDFINNGLEFPLFQLRDPIFNVAFVDPDVSGTGRIIEIDSFTLTYPTNVSDYYPSFDDAVLALRDQEPEKGRVICVVGSADDTPAIATGDLYNSFIIISGNRILEEVRFEVAGVDLVRTDTRDIIFTQTNVVFSDCELYSSNLVFQRSNTNAGFGHVQTILSTTVGCNIFRTITLSETEDILETFQVLEEYRTIVKDTLYSMVLVEDDEVTPINLSYSENHGVTDIRGIDEIALGLKFEDFTWINKFSPGITPENHDGDIFTIGSVNTRLVVRDQLLSETNYKSGLLVLGHGRGDDNDSIPLAASNSGTLSVSEILKSNLIRLSNHESSTKVSKGFSTKCRKARSHTIASSSPPVCKLFAIAGIALIALMTYSTVSSQIKKWQSKSNRMAPSSRRDPSLGVSNPKHTILFKQQLPLPPDFDLIVTEGSNFTYDNQIDNEKPVLANTCKIRFSQLFSQGVLVPFTLQCLSEILSSGEMAPEPEGKMIINGIVDNIETRTPGVRTAYATYSSFEGEKLEVKIGFTDNRILYLDASQGSIKVFLPVSDDPNDDGCEFILKRIDTSFHSVIIQATGTTIDQRKYLNLKPERVSCSRGHDHRNVASGVRVQFASGAYWVLA